jgi:hypothetical protein
MTLEEVSVDWYAIVKDFAAPWLVFVASSQQPFLLPPDYLPMRIRSTFPAARNP